MTADQTTQELISLDEARLINNMRRLLTDLAQRVFIAHLGDTGREFEAGIARHTIDTANECLFDVLNTLAVRLGEQNATTAISERWL